MENIQEAKEQVSNLEEKVTEANEESQGKETLESLKAELENTKKDLDKWMNEAKANRSGMSTLTKKVNDYKALNTKVDTMATMLADLMDNIPNEEDGDKPKSKKGAEYLSRIQKQSEELTKTEREEQERYIRGVGKQIFDLTNGAGMDLKDSAELRGAYVKWLEGDFDGALEETKKTLTSKPRETEEEKRKKWIEEGKRQALEGSGSLNTDTGSGARANLSFSREQIEKMSAEEYKKKEPEIKKAIAEGRLK